MERPLADEIRPQTLDEVVGQKHISIPLQRAIEQDRLAHAYLFSGPRGTGKTSMAKILAKAVNCLHPNGVNPCNECQSCREINAGSSLDVYEIDAASNRGIEEIRALRESVRTLPAVSRKKVYIIDEVHMLTKEAFNALLKTLEEPEGNVHFILITHDLDALLPTIISRGERFGFLPLSENDYDSFIHRRKDIHFPRGMDEKILFQLSEGNPGITLEVCDEGGSAQPESAMDFWETVTGSDRPFSTLSSMEFKERKDFLKMLRWILLVGRDIYVLAETGNPASLRCVTVAAREKRIAPFWQGEKGEEALLALKTAETAVARYINIKNIWDMILITLEHIQKGEKEWIR